MELLLTGIAIVVVLAWVWNMRRSSLPPVPDSPETLFSAPAVPVALSAPDPTWFGDEPGTLFPGPKARLWALARLHDEGVDADADLSYTASLLLKHEPRLTQTDADTLIRSLL